MELGQNYSMVLTIQFRTNDKNLETPSALSFSQLSNCYIKKKVELEKHKALRE